MAFKHQWSDVENFVIQAFEGNLPEDFSFKGYVHSSPWHTDKRMLEEFGDKEVLLVVRNGSAFIHVMDKKIHDYHETLGLAFSKQKNEFGEIVVGFSIGFRYRATARTLKKYTVVNLPELSEEFSIADVQFAGILRANYNEISYNFIKKLAELI